MNELSFAYWLKGFFEITNEDGQQLSAQQVQIIKDHLDLVFKKETPVYTATRISYPVPVDGYGKDLGGIKLSDIKLPVYGDQYGTPNRDDDIFPCYTGIDEMQRATSWINANNPDLSYFNLLGIKDLGYGFTNSYKGLSGVWRAKTLEDIEWEKANSGPATDSVLKDIYIDTEIIPNTPVENTTTYPYVRWDGPQVSC